MHYKNGRLAQPGDKVVNLATGEAGLIYDLNAHATTCNGRLARIASNDSYVTVGDCVHIDDTRNNQTDINACLEDQAKLREENDALRKKLEYCRKKDAESEAA